MMKKTNMLVTFAAFLTFSAWLWIAPEANAVPAFARQTGVACSTCHFQHYPALNAFGRAFKAGGYTQVGGQSLIEGDDLSIPATLNASLVTKVRYQMTNGKDDTSTPTVNESKVGKNKGELQFPDEAALLIGGRAGEHVGFLLEAGLNVSADAAATMFTSYKMPIVFDIGGPKLSIIPFTTDGLGASYGFELLNTGAVRHQRALEHRSETSAQQYIGTSGAAEGFAFVAYNETGFINLTLWGPAHGTVATGFDLSQYVRVAATPNVGGWDLGIGGQYWGGETKVGDTDNTPSAIYATQAWAVDAQAQGNVGMPLGVYLSYGTAAASKDAKNGLADGTTKTSLFNANKNDKTAWSILAELGVLPGKATLAAGYRSGDNGAAANNKEDAITGGATYLLAQNVQLQLNYTSYSGSARDKAVNSDEDNTLTTLMLFAAF
ncbi:MAG: hypothetical protein HZB54_00515 [Deltaproteobacteria bacterium]|nr:hypothetical protein [Deltaproteobacteria bacterium]